MSSVEKYFVLSISALVFILGTQAYFASGEGWLEEMDPLFEFVNMVLALVAASMSLHVARKFGLNIRDGASWRWFAIAMLLFGMVEFNNLLKYLKVLNIEGLYEFLEFGFIVALTLGFNAQKQVITDIIQVISKRVGQPQ
jgi:hypothetical protein